MRCRCAPALPRAPAPAPLCRPRRQRVTEPETDQARLFPCSRPHGTPERVTALDSALAPRPHPSAPLRDLRAPAVGRATQSGSGLLLVTFDFHRTSPA